MQEVDKDYCLGFIDYLNHARRKDGKIMAKVTTAGYLRCLNCALNQAVRDEIISENPITKIDSDQRIKIPESTREYLTLEEVKTLINAPCRNVIVKQAFLFSCFTGLRIGDVQKLKWSDISKEEGRYKVKIVMSKTKKTLYQPLGKEAVKYLPECGNAPDGEFIFQLPSTLNRTLKQWVHDCGIHKNITYHSARHTYATMLLTCGVDLYTVSKLLGHTQVKTTQIYAKVIDQKKDEAVNRLDTYFGGNELSNSTQHSDQNSNIVDSLINADNIL